MTTGSRRLVWLAAALVVIGCGAKVSLGTKKSSVEGPLAGQAGEGAPAGTGQGGASTGGASTGGASTGGASTGGARVIASIDYAAPCVADPLVGITLPVRGGVTYSFEPLATDTLILVERSASMLDPLPDTTVSRWDGVRSGVERFVAEYAPDGSASLALQFFGHSTRGTDSADCNAETYASPTVPFGNPADTPDAVSTAFRTAHPAGEAQTLPALEAALRYVEEYENGTPKRFGRVVLVTDGEPSGCSGADAIDQLAQAAAEAAYPTEPPISTYVVQLGTSVDLNPVAVAGGTDAVYLIGTGDVADDLFNALYYVSFSSRMPCVYALPNLPAGVQIIEPSLTSVIVHDGADERVVPHVGDRAGCSEIPFGGWYYDEVDDRSAIELCPCTCASVFRASSVEVVFHSRPL